MSADMKFANMREWIRYWYQEAIKRQAGFFYLYTFEGKRNVGGYDEKQLIEMLKATNRWEVNYRTPFEIMVIFDIPPWMKIRSNA